MIKAVAIGICLLVSELKEVHRNEEGREIVIYCSRMLTPGA
jgi:hypothetical protein